MNSIYRYGICEIDNIFIVELLGFELCVCSRGREPLCSFVLERSDRRILTGIQ